MKKIFFFLLVLLAGCCPKQTVVREEKIPVVPPMILDQMTLESGNRTDTVYYAVRIVDHDTIRYVRIDTVLKKLYLKVKPDTCWLTVKDTVTIVQTRVEEFTLMEKLGFAAFGGLATILLCLGFAFLVRK